MCWLHLGLDVAASYHNMGSVYDSQGQYENFESARVLSEGSRYYCPGGRDSKYNLASLHKTRRETEKARQLFLECEQIYSAVYGPDHSETQDAARRASLCV